MINHKHLRSVRSLNPETLTHSPCKYRPITTYKINGNYRIQRTVPGFSAEDGVYSVWLVEDALVSYEQAST